MALNGSRLNSDMTRGFLRQLLRLVAVAPILALLQSSASRRPSTYRPRWLKQAVPHSGASSNEGGKRRQTKQKEYDLSSISPPGLPVVPSNKMKSTTTGRGPPKNAGLQPLGDNERLNVLKKPDLRTQLNYARNGHAVVRQLLAPDIFPRLRSLLLRHGQRQELAAWRQKVLVAADHDPDQAKRMAASCQTIGDCQKQLRRLLGVDRVDLPFLQYFNTWRTHPRVFAVAAALAESAAILLDVPAVRLYQDAVFWKRSEDGPTPWHTDARMAPFDTSNMITFWIPLQPVKQSGLVFCSKSHSDFALPFWSDVAEANSADSPWSNLEERYCSLPCVDYMPMELGDVTVHSGWTLHCAGAGGDEDRLALAITFVDARAPIRRDAVAGSCKGDREDIWSFHDWVCQVPHATADWHHPLAPIVWPPKRMNKERRE